MFFTVRPSCVVTYSWADCDGRFAKFFFDMKLNPVLFIICHQHHRISIIVKNTKKQQLKKEKGTLALMEGSYLLGPVVVVPIGVTNTL